MFFSRIFWYQTRYQIRSCTVPMPDIRPIWNRVYPKCTLLGCSSTHNCSIIQYFHGSLELAAFHDMKPTVPLCSYRGCGPGVYWMDLDPFSFVVDGRVGSRFYMRNIFMTCNLAHIGVWILMGSLSCIFGKQEFFCERSGNEICKH